MVTAQYYECTVGQEGRADEIVEEVLAPILNRHMEAGHINSWGWLGHDTGGHWRGVGYWSAPDMETMFSTRAAIVAEFLEENADAAAELNTGGLSLMVTEASLLIEPPLPSFAVTVHFTLSLTLVLALVIAWLEEVPSVVVEVVFSHR